MSIINAVHVHEVTMAAPNIIKVLVRDQEFEKYPPVYMGEEYAAWNSKIPRINPATGANTYGKVVGMGNNYMKFYSPFPTNLMNRANADLVSAYPSIGGRNVVSVSRCTMPYQQGFNHASSETTMSTMEHELYITLDGNLPVGTHVISHNLNAFPSNTFTFHPNTTRSASISTTQLGHRPEEGGKIAYLQLWLPDASHANNGSMNLKSLYGLTNFHVMDAIQRIRYTGPIEQVAAPDTDEVGPTRAYFPAANVPPKTVTAVNTTTQTFTIVNHGYANGEYKYFRAFGGTSGITDSPMPITVSGPNTFNVAADTFTGTWVANTYIVEHDSKVYNARYGNRYGTCVFKMDYSAFRPTDANNQYRIYIPEIGVSDEFRVDNAIYFRAATMAAKGLYNMTLGIPLSMNVGGYERPVNFRDNVNNVYVYESYLPGTCHSEDLTLGGPGVTTIGQRAIWDSGVRVNDWYGCMQDAGDWDWHVVRHLPYIWELVEFGYVQIPAASRNLHFGFPKANSVFTYTTDYQNIDGLPDAIHIALYYLEPLRRFQKVDGRVYAGMNYWLRNDGGSFGGGDDFEPSWISSQVPHMLAADHASNFMYAQLAAQMGEVLFANGHMALGNAWIQSANLAYIWANNIQGSYDQNVIFGTAFRDYYITTLDFQTRSGWSNTTMNTHWNAIGTAARAMRQGAAGCLYSAMITQGNPNNVQYHGVMTANLLSTGTSGWQAPGLWKYVNAPGANTQMVAYFPGYWYNDANVVYQRSLHQANNTIYYSSGQGIASPQEGMFRLFVAALRSNVAYSLPQELNNDNRYLKQLYRGENFSLGANPYNLSGVSGIGMRGPTVLFRDAEVMNVSVPGLPCYMGRSSWETMLMVNNGEYQTWYYTCRNVLFGDPYASSGGIKKLTEPYQRMVPPGMYHFKNTFVIYATEFVLAGLLSRLAAYIFLHAWDGNNNQNTSPATTFLGRCT